MKKYEEAQAFYQQSIDLWSSTFGANNVQTAAGYNGLGMNYFLQGRYDEALPLFRQSRSIREKAILRHQRESYHGKHARRIADRHSQRDL